MKDKNETEKGFYSESEEEGEEEADSSGTTESADSGEDDSDEEESGTRGSCLDLCSPGLVNFCHCSRSWERFFVLSAKGKPE